MRRRSVRSAAGRVQRFSFARRRAPSAQPGCRLLAQVGSLKLVSSQEALCADGGMGIMTRRFRAVWVACSVGICLLPLAIAALIPSDQRSVGRSRAVRPARRRPHRSGQAGGRQRRSPKSRRPISRQRSSSAGCAVDTDRGTRFTSSVAPTRPIDNWPKRSAPIARRPTEEARRPWSNSACCSRPGRAFPRTKSRRASCSSARRGGQSARRHQSRRPLGRRRHAVGSRARRGPCLRRRRIQIRQKRSISSD